MKLGVGRWNHYTFMRVTLFIWYHTVWIRTAWFFSVCTCIWVYYEVTCTDTEPHWYYDILSIFTSPIHYPEYSLYQWQTTWTRTRSRYIYFLEIWSFRSKNVKECLKLQSWFEWHIGILLKEQQQQRFYF